MLRGAAVRRATKSALAHIAEKGDQQAIFAITAQPDKRHDGAEALAQITAKGDQQAISTIAANLED